MKNKTHTEQAKIKNDCIQEVKYNFVVRKRSVEGVGKRKKMSELIASVHRTRVCADETVIAFGYGAQNAVRYFLADNLLAAR